MTKVAERSLDVSVLLNTKLTVKVDIPEALTILEDGQSVPKGFGCFRILHPEKGDERVTWDSTMLNQIQEAKKMFLDLVKKGLTPYRVGVNGSASSQVMQEFDPHAEEVIFMPTALVVGG